MVELLLRAGANSNAIDRHGNGPLWKACYEAGKDCAAPDRLAIISLLLRAGADANHANNAGRSAQIFRGDRREIEAAFHEAEQRID